MGIYESANGFRCTINPDIEIQSQIVSCNSTVFLPQGKCIRPDSEKTPHLTGKCDVTEIHLREIPAGERRIYQE